MNLNVIPTSWKEALGDEFQQDYFQELEKFVDAERQQYEIYPPEDDVFNAFRYTPLEKLNVLIVGQDPYHGAGQAHGLCFSVLPGVKIPPSLRNIYKELNSDLGCTIPSHGCLTHWAEQGVFLLNTVLTVRSGDANSHQKKGWEQFTDAVIKLVGNQERPVVFILWGKPAQKKKSLINTELHTVIESAHPSPLAAKHGFFGSQPFSKTNAALKASHLKEIDWQIPEL